MLPGVTRIEISGSWLNGESREFLILPLRGGGYAQPSVKPAAGARTQIFQLPNEVALDDAHRAHQTQRDVFIWESGVYLVDVDIYVYRTHQSSLGLYEGPILSVHLVVETAGVAEVVSGAVPSPQRRRRGPAVDALAALCEWIDEKYKLIHILGYWWEVDATNITYYGWVSDCGLEIVIVALKIVF